MGLLDKFKRLKPHNQQNTQKYNYSEIAFSKLQEERNAEIVTRAPSDCTTVYGFVRLVSNSLDIHIAENLFNHFLMMRYTDGYSVFGVRGGINRGYVCEVIDSIIKPYILNYKNEHNFLLSKRYVEEYTNFTTYILMEYILSTDTQSHTVKVYRDSIEFGLNGFESIILDFDQITDILLELYEFDRTANYIMFPNLSDTLRLLGKNKAQDSSEQIEVKGF